MNALQKVKLTKELLGLVASLKGGQLKALDKVKTTKRVLELVALLGGGKQAAEPEPMAQPTDHTPFLQSVINGEANVTKDNDVVDRLEQIADQADPELLSMAAIAAAKQVIIANGYVVV